jgi:hypothetical protein
MMGDPAAPLDRGRLDHDEPRPRHPELHQVLKVPVGRRAVVGRVLAHRRDHDPVGELHRAQRQLLEQLHRHRLSSRFAFLVLDYGPTCR